MIKVGISQGDANGISYEVIIKALADERVLDSCVPVIYGSSKVFAYYKNSLHNLEEPISTHSISNAKDAVERKINIVNCLSDNVVVEPGVSTADSAQDAIKALSAAVRDLKNGVIDVLVTAPFNKRAIANQGFKHTGHTEYLKQELGAKDVLMIMVSPNLKVGCVTGHIPLRDVPTTLTQEKILKALRLMNASLRQDFCIPRPRIAVLGLNPHCGDLGLIGGEEQNIIIPAVKQAMDEGIDAFGPYSPDGFFSLGNYQKFDGVMAMYHDQGLIPFKALAFDHGVNYSAGLPFVRTSPDHGTAYDMVGRDEASPLSMRSSIFAAVDIYKNRIRYAEMQKGRLEEPSPRPWEPRDKRSNIE